MMRWIENGWPSAGLYVGALSWMVSTQANYMLAHVVCAHQRVWLVPALSLALALISSLGALVSWRALSGRYAEPNHGVGEGPHRFIAIIGMASAALFAAVILLQGMAGLVLDGCER